MTRGAVRGVGASIAELVTFPSGFKFYNFRLAASIQRRLRRFSLRRFSSRRFSSDLRLGCLLGSKMVQNIHE